ncbi:ABC transporter permease [Microvirga tunisiensis]|uniref:ABC transporter permease subunit n=1 Tax=Microvirga tunisiensis TaxID=2108360 RepID=A0A5N7MKU2_9HYPH|nr:ABC transporter permease subunit [Microvirga tunisiensis]MPR09459.1 ABC transporter permease subunit [Microvirga tunisiensis]MPR27665.1 ABC transporter permease subunit [Microvirga tunisiensis]
MSWDFFLGLFPQLVDSFWITLSLWLLSSLIGLLVATGIAVMSVSKQLPIRWIALGFITTIRGTPLLVQIYILYYGVGNLIAQVPGIRSSFMWPILRDGYWYALLALIISCAAYSGEILRGAIMNVPKGEIEAAKSLGLSKTHMWRLIILPRAYRIGLPSLGGESIILLKATVLASTITVMDLLGMANYIRMQTFKIYEPLLAVAIVYVLLTFILTRGVALLERRYQY